MKSSLWLWFPTICFPILRWGLICSYFLEFSINASVQYLLLFAWLLSLRVNISRPIRVAAPSSSLSLPTVWFHGLAVCTIDLMTHLLVGI